MRVRERSSAAPRDGLVLSILAGGVFALTLLQSVILPALPHLQRELETDQASAAWVLTAFFVAASVSTPIGGRLGDSYGKRRVFVASLVALAVGSLVAAVAESIEVMIAARVLQGLGGGVVPLAFALVRDQLSCRRVPSGLGMISAVLSVGFGIGLAVAGPITETLGYQWLFLIPGAVAALAAGAAMVIPDARPADPRPVPLGAAVLLGGWLVCLLLGLSKASAWGWTSPATLGLLAASLTLLALWLLAERGNENALVDLSLMARRGVWTTNLIAFLVGLVMFGTFSIVPALSQTPPEVGYGFGSTVSGAGLLMLPVAIGSFLSGLAAVRLAALIGVRSVLVAGSMIASTGLFLLAFAHSEMWEVCVSAALIGMGLGVVLASVVQVVVASVPQHQTGVAAGMNANLRMVGGATGVAVLATIVSSHLGPTGLPVETGYVVGFCVLGAAALLSAGAALLVPLRRSAQDEVVVRQVPAVGQPT